MVKMHKSPTRRRFPCAGDVPRFHHLRVRQRRVFRRTAGSQSRSFCSFPRFRRWWRGHALCVTSRVFLHAKSPARRNSMNSFSLCDGLRVYVPRVLRRHFSRKERKKDSLSRRRTQTPSSRSRERERERERKRLRFLRVKNGANRTIPPKRKSALEVREMMQRDGNDGETTRVNATRMNNLHDALRARETYGFNEKNTSFQRSGGMHYNASRRKRGRIGRRRRRLESDDRRGGGRRRDVDDDARRRKTTEGKRGKGNQ